MEAGMNAVVERGVMMVMMGERVRATGIRHGAPAGRRGAAEGRLADGAGHGRERHAHQREIPRPGMARVVMMVVQVVMRMVLLLLLLMMVMMMMEVMAVLMAEARVHRVPGSDNFRLRSVGQDVQDTEGFDATVIGLPFPFVLLVRVLNLHHLEALERLEVIVSGAGSGRAVAAGPTVDVLFLLVIILLVVPERRDGVTALTGSATCSSVQHPVVAVAGVALLVLRHRVARVGPSRAQTIGVIFPRGRHQLVLRVGCHHHQRQGARATYGDLVVVVLHVPSTRRTSARRPSVRRRAAHATGRRRAGRYRRRRRHRVRFRHLRGAHAVRTVKRAKLKCDIPRPARLQSFSVFFCCSLARPSFRQPRPRQI